MKEIMCNRCNASVIKNFLNNHGEILRGVKGTRALYQRYPYGREIFVFEVEDGNKNDKCFIFEYDHGNLRTICTQHGAMETYMQLVCATEATEYVVW